MLWVEHRQDVRFEPSAMASGGTGVIESLAWVAHAPHLPRPLAISNAAMRLLGHIGPGSWVADTALPNANTDALDELLRKGIVIAQGDQSAVALADERLRSSGWFAGAAVYHHASRTQGLDAVALLEEAGMRDAAMLPERFGPAPALRHPASQSSERVSLPAPVRTALDDWLDRRTVCRNFDTRASVDADTFSRILARVFGQRGRLAIAPGFEVIKRTSPSGGALHPTECWLIVQRVTGIAPGLYHYDPLAHALAWVAPGAVAPNPGDRAVSPAPEGCDARWSEQALQAFARIAMCGQKWFADAAVQCILAPRVARSFWKYRNHPRVYRVLLMDVGHLSQTLQLCAMEEGLGSFVTGAINEADIETAFGLDGLADVPLAICGFGPRSALRSRSELDAATLARGNAGG